MEEEAWGKKERILLIISVVLLNDGSETGERIRNSVIYNYQ
jgi:hypothetical protein